MTTDQTPVPLYTDYMHVWQTICTVVPQMHAHVTRYTGNGMGGEGGGGRVGGGEEGYSKMTNASSTGSLTL